jgi:superfamily II DNA or RNA helicase
MVSREALETGQNVRWRGRRWRVVGEEEGGFVRLAGIELANRDQIVTPLLALEADAIQPDERPLPKLDVHQGDRSRWRAMHQAYMAAMAGGREQLVGLDWGAVAVEPYQVVPLLRAANSLRPRLLIADDTGLGKTAEAGLILRWLAQRHQAGRVLVVTRAAPEPQRWQRELWIKFGFRFHILRSGGDFMELRRRAPTVNVFAQQPRMIVSMTLAARQAFLDELRHCQAAFDVVIVDEAHHLAERGTSVKRLTLLGRVLADKCRDGALLLLTATPHDGRTESFLSLLRLLDDYVEVAPGEVALDVASRLVVRRLKSEVTLAGGRRFIPPQIHLFSTLGLASRHEQALERPLDAYLRWLSEEETRYQGRGERQAATGCQFLAAILRKRFGSSVAALRATLRRRLHLPPDPEDLDDRTPFVDTEASDPEDEVIDPGAAAETPPPPLAATERELAAVLLEAAKMVPGGRDAKLEALAQLMKSQVAGEKAVVFTEYRDTLRAAARRLDAEGISHVLFHGETPDADREQALTLFNKDPDVQVFLSTDAASEGQNLQRQAHHLIHLDVPWNPNRYVQRNGRIDRYGQQRQPHIWVLVAADRRRKQGRPEYRALELVVEKLDKMERELGSVSPVLPRLSSGSLQDLLLRAEATTEEQVDRLMDDPRLLEAGAALTRLAVRNRREIGDAESYVRGLGTVDDFEGQVHGLLATAFRAWDDGGRLDQTGPGLFRVSIPHRLQRELDRTLIEPTTFLRQVAVAGQEGDEVRSPEFLSPGHPLVEAVARRLRDEAADPTYLHRFDVVAGTPAGLVLSFSLRFVDGSGHTVEERLAAVEVSLQGVTSRDPAADMERLGVTARTTPAVPDAAAVQPWQVAFPRLAEEARREVARRASARQRDLEDLSDELRMRELEALAVWKHEEVARVELISFGTATQLSLEAAAAYEERRRKLDAEHERRLAAIRERAHVRLAGIELIGGRLIVRAAP